MFRRREGRGSDNNNETRFAKNLTSNPITLGDIDNLELLPGKSVDLLKHASIQRIGSSVDLKTSVQSGWVRLKDRDQNTVATGDICEALIPAILRDVTGTGSELIRDTITVTGDYNLNTSVDDLILVNATATITLPTAVGVEGYHFIVKNIKLGATVTIATTESETIDGESTQIITQQYVSLTFVSNGSNWFIV